MPSHLTSAVPAPPQRRGRERVAAILAAAIRIFAEKGYEAATMTEIAARSDTAIGSLYRFFPSKEALAEALLQLYHERMTAALDGIAGSAATLAPHALADTLVDALLDLGRERAAAVALIDARQDAAATRAHYRDSLRGRMAKILAAAGLAATPARAATRAILVLQLLKTLPALSAEDGDGALVAEMRSVLRLYLQHLHSGQAPR